MAWVGKEFALGAAAQANTQVADPFFDAFYHAFDAAIGLDPNCGLAWIGNAPSIDPYNLNGPAAQIFNKAVELNPKYAADLLSGRSTNSNFKREVFLKEGFPRNSEGTRLYVAHVPSLYLEKRQLSDLQS